jgi:hypothetical protein
MALIQDNRLTTIPGPHQLFGPGRAALSFFKDPIGFFDFMSPFQ